MYGNTEGQSGDHPIGVAFDRRVNKFFEFGKSDDLVNDLIGLALTSHNTGQATSAEFSNVSLTGNVSASWEIAEIGATQPVGNDPAPLYVALEDTSGNVVVVTHPDENIIAKIGVAIPDVHALSRIKVRARIEPFGLWVTPESLNVPGQKFTGTVENNLVDGVFEIIWAFRLRPIKGWGWQLFSGIATLVLGVMIWRQFPESSLWAVGLLAGIHMIFAGSSITSVCSATRGAAKDAQAA